MASFASAGVFVIDQVTGARGEIVEDVLFVCEHPGAMPGLAVFGAAAQVGHRDDEPAIEQRPAVQRIVRRDVDVVAAVSGEQRRILAVQLGALAADDAQRDARAVFGNRERARHFGIAEVGRAGFVERRRRHLFRRWIVAIPGWRIKKTLIAKQQIAALARDHFIHGGHRQDRDCALRAARGSECTDLGRPARLIGDVQHFSRGHKGLDRHLALRHHRMGVRDTGVIHRSR